MNVDLTKDSGLIFTAMSAGKRRRRNVEARFLIETSVFKSGLTVGAFFFGLLVDIIGRKWAFNLTCLITCVFGTLIVSHVPRLSSPCDTYLSDMARLRLCTITTPFAPWLRYVVSALEVKFPSTLLSLLNSCLKTNDTSLRSCPSGNLSESSSLAPSLTDLCPNTDATPICLRA